MSAPITKADLPSLAVYEQLGVPYVLCDAWDGPLWTGHCMMLNYYDGYGDEGFLHELMHWIEATPSQRQYPDFRLGRQVNDRMGIFASSTQPNLFDRSRTRTLRTKTHNAGWGESTVTIETANRQEVTACAGMYLYHVLVGNTTWDKPLYPTDAADDFQGIFTPSEYATTAWAKRLSKIVTTILGPTKPATIINYMSALQDLREDDDY